MPWIESHSVIGRHRKFKGLARQLQISLPQAIGHLHLLWHTAIEQAEDGDLSSWTVGAIAESASWEGSEQEFLKAVQDNELMDGQKIHDWLDYAGVYLTSKYKTSNPEKLRIIWAKFGKTYGKEVKRNSYLPPKGSPPNLTNPPNLPTTGIFELLKEVFGEPKSGAEEKKYLDAFQGFVKLAATPVEIRSRAEAYKKACPKLAFTPYAVLHNWEKSAPKPQKAYNPMNP